MQAPCVPTWPPETPWAGLGSGRHKTPTHKTLNSMQKDKEQVMSMSQRAYPWGVIGALSAGVGVIMGALGSHALRSQLGVDSLRAWEIATDYQLVHAIGLLIVDRLQHQSAMHGRIFAPVGGLFLLGTLLFCGSLYGLALTHWTFLGPITPLGGLCLISGWFLLAYRIWSARKKNMHSSSASTLQDSENHD